MVQCLKNEPWALLIKILKKPLRKPHMESNPGLLHLEPTLRTVRSPISSNYSHKTKLQAIVYNRCNAINGTKLGVTEQEIESK